MSTADVLKAWLGPALTSTEGDPDGVVDAAVDAIALPMAQTEAVVRAQDGRVGWAALLDPDTAPEAQLQWLAQWVGVELDDRLTAAQWREAIKDRPNAVKGTPAAVKSSANDWMNSDGYTIVVLERADDSPWRVEIRYYAATIVSPTWDDVDEADTWTDLSASVRWADIIDDEEALQASILASIPAEIVPNIRRLDGATYGDLADDFATVGEFETEFAADTIRDVRYYVPEAARVGG